MTRDIYLTEFNIHCMLYRVSQKNVLMEKILSKIEHCGSKFYHVGKSPQNGTERVSVTSANTFFSP